MSIPAVLSIFAVALLVAALIAVMFRGRTARRLGPVNAVQAPGQPPVQNANPATQQVVWFTYRPWMWKTAIALAVVVVFGLIVLYWPSLLLPGELQLKLILVKNSILENLALALLIIGIPLLFLSEKARKWGFGLISLSVLMFFLMPDSSGLNRADRFHAWITTPAPRSTVYSNPEAYRDAVAKEQRTAKCPGRVIVLDASNPSRTIPGPWCLLHYKVVAGKFRVDGTNGYGFAASPLYLSPQGSTVSNDPDFYARSVQLASGVGEMQILECPTGSVIRNWRCWDR